MIRSHLLSRGLAIVCSLVICACSGGPNQQCQTTSCGSGSSRSFQTCGSQGSSVVTEEYGSSSCQVDSSNPTSAASESCTQAVEQFCLNGASGGGSGGSSGGSGGSGGGSGGGSTGPTATCALEGHACGAVDCCSGTCNGGTCACTPFAGNCTEGSECCSGDCASGVCAETNQVGSLCTANANCESGECASGVCACVGAGSGCVANADCCAGSCSSGACANSPAGSGTVGGVSFANLAGQLSVAYSGEECGSTNGGYVSELVIILSSQSGVCGSLESGQLPVSQDALLIELLSTGTTQPAPIGSGVYMVNSSENAGPGPAAFVEAITDGFCGMSASNYNGSTGGVVLTRVDSSGVSGSYTLTFGSGAAATTITGSFDAPACSYNVCSSTAQSMCGGGG